MARATLKEMALDVPALRGLFVAALPDGQLHDAWMRPKEQWSARHLTPSFGDVHRAMRRALETLGSWAADAQVTIESGNVLIVLREVRPGFLAAFAFDRTAAAANVGGQIKRLMQRLQEVLPSGEPEQRPRAVRIVDFLLRHGPDPHTILARVALKTGITLERLGAPSALEPTEVELLEEAVKDVLGLDSLDV